MDEFNAQLIDEFNDAAEAIEMEADTIKDRGPAYIEGMYHAANHLRELAAHIASRQP